MSWFKSMGLLNMLYQKFKKLNLMSSVGYKRKVEANVTLSNLGFRFIMLNDYNTKWPSFGTLCQMAFRLYAKWSTVFPSCDMWHVVIWKEVYQLKFVCSTDGTLLEGRASADLYSRERRLNQFYSLVVDTAPFSDQLLGGSSAQAVLELFGVVSSIKIVNYLAISKEEVLNKSLKAELQCLSQSVH